MAKLKDVLKLDGKAGAFSFTHGRDGFTARKISHWFSRTLMIRSTTLKRNTKLFPDEPYH
jgi:hypothetical protein